MMIVQLNIYTVHHAIVSLLTEKESNSEQKQETLCVSNRVYSSEETANQLRQTLKQLATGENSSLKEKVGIVKVREKTRKLSNLH